MANNLTLDVNDKEMLDFIISYHLNLVKSSDTPYDIHRKFCEELSQMTNVPIQPFERQLINTVENAFYANFLVSKKYLEYVAQRAKMENDSIAYKLYLALTSFLKLISIPAKVTAYLFKTILTIVKYIFALMLVAKGTKSVLTEKDATRGAVVGTLGWLLLSNKTIQISTDTR